MAQEIFTLSVDEDELHKGGENNIQADLRNFKYLQKQGRYMFLVPWESKRNFTYRLLGIVITLILIPIAYEIILLRLSYFRHLPITCLIMDTIHFSARVTQCTFSTFQMGFIESVPSEAFFDSRCNRLLVLFLNVQHTGKIMPIKFGLPCTYNTIFVSLAIFFATQNFYEKMWQCLEARIIKTEFLLRTLNYVAPKGRFSLKFRIIHLLYFLIHGSQIYMWIKLYQINLLFSYTSFRVSHYWALFSTFLIYEWIKFLSRRFKFLDEYLGKQFSKRVIVLHETAKELRSIGKIYKNLSDLVHQSNKIFFYHLTSLTVLSLLITLHGLSFAVVQFYNVRSSLAALGFVTAYFINILVLVLAYEDLKNTSQNIVKTCLFLEEGMEHTHLRAEMERLRKYVKTLGPKLSFNMTFV
ncbi:hypothetical protein ABEB36_011417 [Hypothenemus hampei]|uniref:Gustatory receptor n=1 Tax=Hypothenemus hampei TaxID=57062 RepID=A0ABD1EFW5_HYPHA